MPSSLPSHLRAASSFHAITLKTSLIPDHTPFSHYQFICQLSIMSEPEAPRFTPAAERTSKVTLQERQSHIKYETLELSTDDEPLVKGNDQANPNGKRHVLIIGGGVSGLLPAWMLLDKGYRVTIIAEHWAWTRDFEQSRITSQIAGALWEFPPGGCGLTEIETPGPGFATVEHYREWPL